MTSPIKIGLAGTGFGRRVMLPAFANCENIVFQAVCSATRENADAAAAEFKIPGIYTDFDAMIEQETLDLVLITTPPNFHLPMSLKAFDHNLHVLCEKPTALNLGEAEKMYKAAQTSGKMNIIDHELRFHPTLQKMKSMIEDGFLGAAEKISFSTYWSFPFVRGRTWNWWFDKTSGGGLLGALGSHQIDLLRWLFDTEVKQVNGQLHSFIDELPLKDSAETKPVTTDNYCSIMMNMANGSLGQLTLDASLPMSFEQANTLRTVNIHGENGSLVFDGEDRLWAIQGEEKTEHTQPNPGENTPGLPKSLFSSGFAYLSKQIVDALHQGENIVNGAATFEDGLKIQAVIDAVHESNQSQTWVTPKA